MKIKIIPLLTSCSILLTVPFISTGCSFNTNLETHNMLKPYINHVLPSEQATIIGANAIESQYLKSIKNDTDIIKDDILYTYAKILQNATNKFDYSFSKYYLYVENFDINEDKHSINFDVLIDVKGSIKTSKSGFIYNNKNVSSFDVKISSSFNVPLKFITNEFKVYDTTVLNGDKVFAFSPDQSSKANIQLKVKGEYISDNTNSQINTNEYFSIFDEGIQNKTAFNFILNSFLNIPSIAIDKKDSNNWYVSSHYLKNINYKA